MAGVQDRILFLERKDPQFVWKRKMQIIYLVLRRLVAGIEYGIVLPSGWQYLSSMGAKTWFYGLVLSITPLSGIIIVPIIGWIYDKTKKGKETLFVLNTVTLIGSVLYSLPFNRWLPFLGRFMAGFGVAEAPIIQGEVSWTRTSEERFKIFATVSFGFFLGLCCGPPITLGFEKIDFHVGAWGIDYKNFPGIFLAILWILLSVLNYFMYENLAKNYIDVDLDKLSSQDDSDDGEEEEINVKQTSPVSEVLLESSTSDEISHQKTNSDILPLLLQEVLRTEIVALLFSHFSLWLLVFEGESLLPLISQRDLGWSVFQTNLIYLAIGVTIVISYLLITLIGNRITEFIYLAFALGIGCISSALLLTYDLIKAKHLSKKLIFVFAFIGGGMTEPLSTTSINSILSKVLPLEIQGSVAGLLNNVGKLAHIAGPLYGTLVYSNMLPCNIFSMSTFVVALTWVIASMAKLNRRKCNYQKLNH